MNNITNLFSKLSFICLGIILVYGCSSQRETVANRGLQNLSAKYNYIYNSNILLDTYQEELSRTNADNYDNLLAIYIAPPPIDYLNPTAKARELEDITKKAQSIIAEKNLSNYIDEAYILLGKTNFYNSEYFNAVAYFSYTSRAFKTDKKVFLKALNWKARSLMQMNELAAATKVLDTVKTYLDSVKSNKAEPLATLAQMSIYKSDYKEAISYLKLAIKETSEIQSRTRWPYILAQLYEREKDYNLSLRNYTKVENSNAPFEMYFNAKLSKIRINDALNKLTTNRKQELLKLLKDDKNLDYTDQIYYEVAEDYYADKDFAKAINYYQLSAQKSTINPYQKGLSYLKIAELDFKDLRDYVNAKLYYDSAITTLPKTYPNYESIVSKGQNLGFLTERYQIIAEQDTLQAIAKLSEEDRAKKLDVMFEPKKETEVANANVNNPSGNTPIANSNAGEQGGTFYFGNLNAISKGFADFRKRWGNRQLNDNWRQSVKSSGQINQQNQNATISSAKDGADSSKVDLAATKAEEIKKYIALLPVTPELLTKSNQQIIDAYFEIANFYQQVINDQEEAVRIYELLLERFPQNNHLEKIYYSLYLGYKDTNQAKADIYKNLVLTKYPNSLFAKTILDPNFSLKQNALDIELNKLYNSTFESYLDKDFEKVISSVDEVNQRFPGNNLQAQFDYLKAIAIGRTQHVDSLLTAFNKIITDYPEDQLINPLTKEHVAYIIANLSSFKARKIALLDFDILEPPFISKTVLSSVVKPTTPLVTDPIVEEKPKEILAQNAKPPLASATQATPEAKLDIKIEPLKPVVQKDTTKNEQVIATTTKTEDVKKEPIKPVVNNIFSLAESNSYFYVIAVADASLNVSSSRFGIGQFNRGSHAEENLKHQLIELEQDQLIYVGDFSTLKNVKAYYAGITSLLPKVMKVPLGSYAGFYISKENFSKLKNKETITQYLEFFKNNY